MQKLIITGYLGKDPTRRTTPSGKTVINFSVGVSVYDPTAENNRGTRWYNVTLWDQPREGKTSKGDFIMNFARSGSHVALEADDLTVQSYEARDPTSGKTTTRYSLNARLVPQSFEILDRMPVEEALAPTSETATSETATSAPAPNTFEVSSTEEEVPF